MSLTLTFDYFTKRKGINVGALCSRFKTFEGLCSYLAARRVQPPSDEIRKLHFSTHTPRPPRPRMVPRPDTTVTKEADVEPKPKPKPRPNVKKPRRTTKK